MLSTTFQGLIITLKLAILTAKLCSRVIKPSGTTTLCGMTAGHVLAPQPLTQASFEFVDDHDEEDEEDEAFYSGEEEYELDDTFEGDEEAPGLATAKAQARTDSQSRDLGHLWPKIGSVYAASNEGTTTGQDLDWALVAFDEVTDCRPNLLIDRQKASPNRPLKENAKSTEDGSSRNVYLLSGTGGVKNATLSTSLSFLMMGAAKAFTKTYTLVLPHGSGKCAS